MRSPTEALTTRDAQQRTTPRPLRPKTPSNAPHRGNYDQHALPQARERRTRSLMLPAAGSIIRFPFWRTNIYGSRAEATPEPRAETRCSTGPRREVRPDERFNRTETRCSTGPRREVQPDQDEMFNRTETRCSTGREVQPDERSNWTERRLDRTETRCSTGPRREVQPRRAPHTPRTLPNTPARTKMSPAHSRTRTHTPR